MAQLPRGTSNDNLKNVEWWFAFHVNIPWLQRPPFLQQKVVIYLERISFINLAMYGLLWSSFPWTDERQIKWRSSWAACWPCYSFASLLQLFDYRWSSGTACIDVSKRTCWPHFFKSRNRWWAGSSVPIAICFVQFPSLQVDFWYLRLTVRINIQLYGNRLGCGVDDAVRMRKRESLNGPIRG